jgi:predicted secreted hydrolase
MKTVEAVETWTGPGKSDAVIVPLGPAENAAHPMDHKNYFEHWYFDARLEDGHVIVGFLQSSELITRKPGVELHVYTPDGEKLSVKKTYGAGDVSVSTDVCDVTVGPNHCRAETSTEGALPVYRVQLAEDDLAFDLTFRGLLPGWKPGGGKTCYGDTDFFAWVVPAPKAAVEGTVRIGGTELDARGTGYHDHNWGIGDMKRIIDRWYWGRIYAEDFTLLYAYVMTTRKYNNARSTPLMLAHGDRIILSTGDVTLESGETVFDRAGNRDYPSSVSLKVPGSLGLNLEVRKVIDAHDFLEDVPVVRSRAIKPLVNRLLGRPGYFRFDSDYHLRVIEDGQTYERAGTTMHEMVALR